MEESKKILFASTVNFCFKNQFDTSTIKTVSTIKVVKLNLTAIFNDFKAFYFVH